MPTFAEMHTPAGHLCGEATSALQKSIRRGLEEDALYWASELDLAGYGNYVWKRLRIIATEDVGLADPEAVLLTRTLYENWLEQRKADGGDTFETALFLLHGVLILARANKSRICDHALMVFYEGDREHREVPDYALDKHTSAGRKKGRGLDHFLRRRGEAEGQGAPRSVRGPWAGAPLERAQAQAQAPEGRPRE
jgi:replication-associated recombination protein RarA